MNSFAPISCLGKRSLKAVVASVLAVSAVTAQEEGNRGGLEEIVVTATRREESLKDVPLSVTAVTAESLVTRGVNGLADLNPGAVPGVIIGQFSGTPSTLAIGIRGVGLSDPTQGTTELPVPVYIDGVFLGRAQGLGLELIDPERVEILRGPQGQLFGRNAEGGVVQYVSRKPSGEFGVKASASYGNYNDQRYRLSVDLPEVSGFSTQFSVVKSKHDPYTDNRGPKIYEDQADYGAWDSWGARGAVRWQNQAGFTADYTYDYSTNDDSQPYLTWQPVDIVGVTPASPEAPSSDYPSKALGPIFNRLFETKGSGHGLTLAYQATDAITLKSITAHRKASRHGGSNLGWALISGSNIQVPSGIDRFPVAPIFPFAQEDLDQEQTSQELQFIGTWDQFDLTAGAMYYNEKATDRRRSIQNGPGLDGPAAGILPAGLGFCAGLQTCLVGDTIQSAESDSYGLYAQGNYRPAAVPGLELTVGLRYTDDNKDAERTRDFVELATPQEAKFSASRLDPAATIKYAWTDSLTTYARYATGYRAGGANVRSSTFTSFDEEENVAWELGMKALLADNRVSLNVALFHNTIKGEQLTIQEQPSTNPSLTNTTNAKKDKKIKGAEVELFWRALNNLSFGVNFAYMDVKKISELDNPFTAEVGDITRFYTVQVPKTSGSVMADYEVSTLPMGQLAFHVDYSFADDHWNTPGALLVSTLGPNYKRPTSDASQLAARISWRDIEVGETSMEVALWGKNLLDDTAIVYGFDGCASGGGFCTYRTPPRTYGVEVRVNY